MKHVVIGTAGHVDHGKTSLVYALTSVKTDRLPEEERRGITIELGFAPWPINEDLLISIIDAPGHRRLVHTMIAGASGIDLVLLVVAADEGVMPQTREHIAACRLLGVQRAVVAVTKADRVDEELGELAGEEARELLEEHGIAAEVVLCSSKTGQGVDAVRNAVLTAIEQSAPRREQRRVRLSVDRVFSVHGSGTVITGTLVEGGLKLGDNLRILGPERELQAGARSLHIHGQAQTEVCAPTRLAINLSGVSVEQIHRGDVLTDDAHVMPTRILDVWLDVPQALKRGTEASIFIGTARSTAKIQPLEGEVEIDSGQLARLRLNAPIVALGGDRFVLRGAQVDGPAGAVIGGGRVLDATPPRRGRASKRRVLLSALQNGEAAACVQALAQEHSPGAFDRKGLRSRLAIDAESLTAAAKTLAKEGKLHATHERGWISPTALEALSQHACTLVETHHQEAPFEPGLRLQTLREQLSRLADASACSLALDRLTRKKPPALLIENDVVRRPDFSGAAGGGRAAEALGNAKALLAQNGLQGISLNALRETVGSDPKEAKALLSLLVRDNSAIKTGELWFERDSVQTLQTQIVAHLNQQSTLSIQDFKAICGLGRKQSIPLLEYFDREGITKRDGDARIKGPRADT